MDNAPDAALRLHIVRDAIRRRWLFVVALGLLFAAIGMAFVATRTTEYTAAARIQLRAIPGNPLAAEATASSQQIDIAMQTEAQLVASPDVVSHVNSQLGTDLQPGTSRVVPTVPANTMIVRIEFTDASSSGAQKGAQAFAAQFLDYRERQAKDYQGRQIDALTSQLEETQADLDAANEDFAQKNPPPGTQTRVQLLAGRVGTLQESIGNAQAVDTQPGNVITPATAPPSPSLLSRFALVGVAGVFGGIVGLVLIIWWERRDDRIRAFGSGYIAGVPVLADLSQSPSQGPRLLFQQADHDPVREAYRLARAGLLATINPPSTIAVSALSPEVSSTQVAVNLALSLGGAGYDVAVVDATIDDTTVASLLKVDESPGVSDLLSNRQHDSIELIESRGLKVLPAGSDPAGAREYYAGAAINDLIRRLRRKCDLVIVAAPPHGTAESTGVTVHCDGVVLVLADQQDTHEAVLSTLDRASRTNEHVFGAIVVRARKPLTRREAKAVKSGGEGTPTKLSRREKRKAKSATPVDDAPESKPREVQQSGPKAKKGTKVSVRERDTANQQRPSSGGIISAQES